MCHKTRSLLLLLVLAACEANALTNLSPAYNHAGSNANHLTGGRIASVVMGYVPGQALPVAYAAAEAGGVYKGSGGGQTWTGSTLNNGASGNVGLGFAGTGVNVFSQMAIGPTGALAVLAGTGNFFSWRGAGGNGPVWISAASSGGAQWKQAANATAAPAVASGADSQIAFSAATGRAYAVTANSLGISAAGGDNWSWGNPLGVAYQLSGLDVLAASKAQKFFPGTAGDVVAFCAYASGVRQLVLLNTANNQTLKFSGPSADAAIKGGPCQVAFDPQNSAHIFLASNGNGVSQISEGVISAANGSIQWVNLQGASASNGRPAFVQAHLSPSVAKGTAVYYHDTVNLWTKTCTRAADKPNDACPVGGWTQVKTIHGDYSKIAFDAKTHCPVYISDDGGLELSGDCGATWNTVKQGLHATMPWNASFGGQGTNRTMILDLQDNGLYFGNGQGAWTQKSCGDGFWSAMHPLDPATAFTSCNGGIALFKSLPGSTAYTVFDAASKVSPDLPLVNAYDSGTLGAFAFAGTYEIPAFDAGGHLQMWGYSVSSGSFYKMGLSSSQSFSTADRGGDFSEAGGVGQQRSYLATAGGLYEFDGQLWYKLAGPAKPKRVWGDNSGKSADAGRIYVLDGQDNALWYSTDGVKLTKDTGLTQLVTANGKFANTIPADACPGGVCSVAYDPANHSRIAVGTAHNGILFSANGGLSWSVNAVPEPNGGITSLYFDPKAGPNGENALAAIWGEGLWAVKLQAAAFKFGTIGNLGSLASLPGQLYGVDGVAIPNAQLQVNIYNRNTLRTNGLNVARYQLAYDPIVFYGLLNDGDAPSVGSPSTTAVQAILPPVIVNPVVRNFSNVLTTATGNFAVPLPRDLPAGNYHVQLTYPGDRLNPPTTAGFDYVR